jgi:hypothetical protein
MQCDESAQRVGEQCDALEPQSRPQLVDIVGQALERISLRRGRGRLVGSIFGLGDGGAVPAGADALLEGASGVDPVVDSST